MFKAVFLDRDGVINELVYHQEQEVIDSPFTVGQFKLIEGVPAAINKLQQAGYIVIVASNQPGVAKDQMSLATFEKIREKMQSDLAASGAILDAEYYCLHHPDAKVAKYKANCDCRKPKPGMLLHAAKDLCLDIKQSWFIGDNLSDVQAGKSAGCRTILIGKMKCDLCDMMDQRKVRPDYVAEDITKAASLILQG